MIECTVSQMARMAEGELINGSSDSSDSSGCEVHVAGVSTDTRSLQPGNLFVPLVGEAYDGHDYLAEAVNKGAVCALWRKDKPLPKEDLPLVLVDDTLLALQRLARAYRCELTKLRVVGITGSNGKTTTKDLTAAALGAVLRTHKTPGNLNNHIGLPLTLLRMDADTEAAVIEMGMSGRGEIALLASIVKPDVVVITNIGESHLLQLGSRAEIARAKTEALGALKPGGLFVYNGDEPLIAEVLPEMAKPVDMQSVRFGMGPDNDLYPLDIELVPDGTRFTINATPGVTFRIPLAGSHNAQNALAAYAVARHFGLSDAEIVRGLSQAEMTGMRIEQSVTSAGITVLNDAYNASPASTRAALALFGELRTDGRKIAVLGDMLELGGEETAYHAAIGEAAAACGVDILLAYGPLSLHTVAGARKTMPAEAIRHYTDKSALIADLLATVSRNDAVLVKASRGMRLEEVVNSLTGENAKPH